MSLTLLTASLLLAQPPAARVERPGASKAHLPVWPVRLQSSVVKITKSFNGELALYVEDVRTRERYGYNAETPMYLASGIKIPVMVALYEAVVAGEIRLEDNMVFRTSDIRDGAPLLNYIRPGTPISLGALLEAMIRSSDNAATDMLIRRVGLERVNSVLPREGITGFGPITTLLDVRRLVYQELDPAARHLTHRDIFELGMKTPMERRVRVLEGFLGVPPETYTVVDYHTAFDRYYLQGWNSAAMRSMGFLLSEMVRGHVISPTASEKMLQVMLGTRTGTHRLRAGLGSRVRFAHKTGTQNRRTCDFGIAFLPPDRRPVVIAASVIGTRPSAERLLHRVGSAVVRAFHPRPKLSARKSRRTLGTPEDSR